MKKLREAFQLDAVASLMAWPVIKYPLRAKNSSMPQWAGANQ
jgi:hypothetical protein